MSNRAGQPRLAVLIDGDNVSHRLADKLFAGVGSFGVAVVRRLYGNFGSSAAQGWKDAVYKHAIVAQQHFANASSKNGTDISLVIDAMDLLHRGGIDGFCIVSSDSDYTPLATRIREQGLTVIGFGSTKAALSFQHACQKFVELDIPESIIAKAVATPKKPVSTAPKVAKPTLPTAPIARARSILLQAFDRLNGPEWVPLTDILKEVRAVQPEFNAKAYGSSKPVTLVRKTQCFDVELVGGTTLVRIRPAFPVSTAA